MSKDVAAKAGGKDAAKRDQTRTNKESGDRMTSGGHIGGAFSVTTNPAFLETRAAYFETLWAVQQAATAALQSTSELAINVTLPDGSVKQGVAFKTSPYDIAKAISTGLADSIIIAKVCYTSRLDGDSKLVQVDDEADEGTLLIHFFLFIILHSFITSFLFSDHYLLIYLPFYHTIVLSYISYILVWMCNSRCLSFKLQTTLKTEYNRIN